jgi:hypothetical protein
MVDILLLGRDVLRLGRGVLLLGRDGGGGGVWKSVLKRCSCGRASSGTLRKRKNRRCVHEGGRGASVMRGFFLCSLASC